jgi:hypothetical protein
LRKEIIKTMAKNKKEKVVKEEAREDTGVVVVEPKKAEPKKEVVVARDTSSVEALLSEAVRNNVSVDVMERLFTLREKVKAEQAKQAFVEAMASFQDACPVIIKTKVVMNKDGRSERYRYAPLDSIVQQIKKPLLENGLAYNWETENKDKQIIAICTITHKLGHSESSRFEVPVDDNQYMTSPQRYASGLTFAKRYSLCNALGISTADEDTDATDVNKEADAISAKSKIIFRLRTLKKPTATKVEIETAVKELTQLELKEENYEEIGVRLQALIDERHEG